MGAQVGMLLAAGCVATNACGIPFGLHLFSKLPADAAVPMKFGLFGEVLWCASKPWFLIYPGLCAFLAATPLLTHQMQAKVPDWVTKPEEYKAIMDTATNAVCLLTGGFLLIAMDQIPRIVRKEQTGILPTSLTGAYLALLFGSLCAAGVAASRLAE
mmetsp:Transcript_67953/g.159351  ORF Transcript_67953/g.159351 Transcript_67953/m.159351 type:complete len:157 (-) Transcript_67953:104-574(-)